MQEAQRAFVIQSPHAGRSMLLSQALALLEQAGVKVAQVLSIATMNGLEQLNRGKPTMQLLLIEECVVAPVTIDLAASPRVWPPRRKVYAYL